MLILQDYQQWLSTNDEKDKFQRFWDSRFESDSAYQQRFEIAWQVAQIQAAMTQMAQRLDALDKKCEFIAVGDAPN